MSGLFNDFSSIPVGSLYLNLDVINFEVLEVCLDTPDTFESHVLIDTDSPQFVMEFHDVFVGFFN